MDRSDYLVGLFTIRHSDCAWFDDRLPTDT